MTSFLDERSRAGRTVTKTPSVKNLEYFPKLFPEAYLGILVRDGRACSRIGDSIVRMEPADRIVEFDRIHRQADARHMIFRFEDLYENLEGELRGILEFVRLDPASYDFGAALQLPVRGSSTIREENAAEVHWKPVEKSEGFDPMSRFSHRTRAQHERFNWVAGQHLERLGYTPQQITSGRALWAALNLILGIRWQAMRLIGPIYLKTKSLQVRRQDSY